MKGTTINIQYQRISDGNPLKLTLRLKEKCENKDYDRYSVCKVVEEDGKLKYIPLYEETFTEKQYNKFFDNPTYYIAVTQDQEQEEV